MIFKNKFLFKVFLLLSCFPWVNLFGFSTDIQPQALLCAFLFLFLGINEIKIHKFILFFLVVPFFYLLFGEFNYLNVRGFVVYVSFSVFYIASFNFYRFNNDSSGLLKIVLLIYILAGLLQIFFDPNLFTFISSRESGYANFQGRGVESLAAEPTFLGIHCAFLFLIYYANNNKSDYLFNILIFICLILISRSSTVLLTVFVPLIFYYIFKIKNSLLILVIIIILFPISLHHLEDVRFISLVNNLIENGWQIIYRDQSVYYRAQEIYTSFAGFFNNPVFGNGFNAYYQATQTLAFDYIDKWEFSADRITSFFGGIGFEVGILPLLIIVFLIFKSSMRYSFSTYKNVSVLFFLILILIQGVPLSYTLLPILLGKINAIWKKDESFSYTR
jgi:hypothetical protein